MNQTHIRQLCDYIQTCDANLPTLLARYPPQDYATHQANDDLYWAACSQYWKSEPAPGDEALDVLYRYGVPLPDLYHNLISAYYDGETAYERSLCWYLERTPQIELPRRPEQALQVVLAHGMRSLLRRVLPHVPATDIKPEMWSELSGHAFLVLTADQARWQPLWYHQASVRWATVAKATLAVVLPPDLQKYVWERI